MRKHCYFRQGKLGNNPIITPGSSVEDPDGFLVDDAVFVLKDNNIWLYHKGYPKTIDEKGKAIRVRHNTFLRVATADKSEGLTGKLRRFSTVVTKVWAG